jgi:hypothetical protein
MSAAQQVSRNLTALDGAPPPEMMRKIEAVLAPVHNGVWTSGRAENNLPS